MDWELSFLSRAYSLRECSIINGHSRYRKSLQLFRAHCGARIQPSCSEALGLMTIARRAVAHAVASLGIGLAKKELS